MNQSAVGQRDIALIINLIKARKTRAATIKAAEVKATAATTKETTRVTERETDITNKQSAAKLIAEAKLNEQNLSRRERKKKERRIASDARKSIKIANKRFDLADKKNVQDREIDILGIEEDIMKDITTAEIIPLMDKINESENRPYYYTQWIDEGFITDTSMGARVDLPINPGTNRQITMSDIRETAKAKNLTVEQTLQAMGVLDGSLKPK